jgi:hypothetical protein
VVAVPANAYLEASGNSWECERGFRQEQTGCARLTMPANAYIDYSGHGWSCADGFHRRDDGCVAD